MFLKFICLIFSLFLIVHCKQKTLEQQNDFDNLLQFLMESKDFRNSAKPKKDESFFTIVAPGTLKSNRKYTTVVSLHESANACTIRITISGLIFKSVKEIILQPFQTKLVDFNLPKLDLGPYDLKAEGINGCNFLEQSPLLVEDGAGPKIYIQTDKAVYKPQDLVQFRILFLDEHTKPLNLSEPILVEIMDAKENIVKQFKDIRFIKGVHTNSFKLSQRPVLGSWSIRVSLSGQYSYMRTKSIQVQKYVLPKFNVHIKAPKYVVTTNKYLKAFFYGRYTFGKYVEGVANVQLRDKFNKKIWQERKINVKTLAGVEFPLENLNQFTSEDTINLVVNLKETLTGTTHNETMQLKCTKQSYNIIVDDKDFEFNGTEPQSLKVRIKYWNGATVLDQTTSLTLKHGKNTYEKHMQDNGVTTFEFQNDPNEGFIIYYKDSNTYIPNLYQNVKDVKAKNINLNLLDNRLRLQAPVRINVSTTENIPYLIYAIVGHGNIIRMQHVKLQPHQNSYVINIKPTIEMIQKSHVFVYYSQNGKLRRNEIELIFPPKFENQIELAAPQEVKPGQNITIELKAKPQSLVALLAVDMGVHILDPSYDLDRNKIINDLFEDKAFVSKELHKSNFLYSGLIILTNLEKEVLDTPRKKAIRQIKEGNPKYRIYFPEVWIFENIEVNTTNTKVSFKVPDSITTWRLTAFSINEKSGFGIVNGPTDIIAIKPFFISLNLPYSIKWGEIVALPILVFNYHNKPLDSTIMMINNEQEFEFIEALKEGNEKSKEQQYKIVKSSVPANNGQLFTIYIKPSKIGDINIKISAKNELYTDAIHQKLKVESEGIEQKKNQPIFINLNNEKPVQTTTLLVDTPSDVDPRSNDIDLSVGGDYIVPTLDNLDKLVDMPTGCGEQNMIHFAPNILILEYLKATGGYRKEKSLVNTIKSYTDIGYQQQLSYRYANGGYSVFGEDVDNEASTWLTAYTIRFFMKASKYATIEKRIIETGLEFLASSQLNDGSFPYTGYLFNPAQENTYGLTAFILTTFLEDRNYAKKYQDVINKGLEFLTKNLEHIDDLYSLSIIAFVLQLAKNPKAIYVLQKLQTYRKQDDDNDLAWWSTESYNFKENDVEITAYILMALLDTHKPIDQLNILKWLIKQRNDKGGFHSTHDTVVGLQALVKFAQKMSKQADVNVNIEYTAKDVKGQELKKGVFKVESGNYLVAQKEKLPISTHNVSIEMSGAGSALLQLSHRFKLLDAVSEDLSMSTVPKWRNKYGVINTTKENDVIHFIIEPKANIVNENDLDLEICFVSQTNTTMVILEADLLSGYRTDDEDLKELESNEFIKRIEIENDFTTVVLYLDHLRVDNQHCVNILAYKTNDILERKPAVIVMYNYYNKLMFNTKVYNI